jgi:hypothetical protein
MTKSAIIPELEGVASLQALLNQAASEKATDRSTGVKRKAAHRRAIEDTDISHLLDLQDKAKLAIYQMTNNKIDLDEPHLLADPELMALMVEYLDQRDIKELLEVRYAMIREAIFAHIDKLNEADEVKDPEHAPREVPVPELNKKWTREGGRIKAGLDKDKLAELLGPERWKQVCKAIIIPEHVEYQLDEDALVNMVSEHPETMELIRDCVIAGGYTPMSLHVRELIE